MKKNEEANGVFFSLPAAVQTLPAGANAGWQISRLLEELKVTPFKSSGGRKLGEGCPGVTFFVWLVVLTCRGVNFFFLPRLTQIWGFRVYLRGQLTPSSLPHSWDLKQSKRRHV